MFLEDFPLSDDGNHSDGGYNTNEVITPPNEGSDLIDYLLEKRRIFKGSLDESALSLFNKIDSKKEEEFLIFDTDMEEFKSEDSRDGDGIGVCCARCEEDKPNKGKQLFLKYSTRRILVYRRFRRGKETKIQRKIPHS